MNPQRSLVWSLSTVLVAALVAFAVAHLVAHRPRGEDASESSFHHWLHANLNITEEQEHRLFPYEEAYEALRRRQRAKIEAAGKALAAAIREHDADSREIEEALQQLLDAQGRLQRITLDHFFAMKEHLTPEQGAKLLQWTENSIVHGHHD